MGFLSKEYLYKAGLQVHIVPVVLLVLGNALMTALCLQLIIQPFRVGSKVITLTRSSD